MSETTVVNLNNLDNVALEEQLVTDKQEISELNIKISGLQDQLRALRENRDKTERILHERALLTGRWCKLTEFYKGRQIFQEKTKRNTYVREFWVYLVEKLEHGYCKAILVGRDSMYAYIPVTIEQLDNNITTRIDKKIDVYYATPIIIEATELRDASLEVVMQDGFLFDLVQHTIPEFKTGLAAYTYKDNKWCRIRTRSARRSGIPSFIRTKGGS